MPSNPEAWRVFYNARSASSAEAETLRDIRRLYIKCKENSETHLYDDRGSVVQLLQGGTVSQSYSYNAYGYINTDEYGIQAPFYGYNGEQHDPATGLQYLRARYYAPQNGSFTTQDSFAGLLTDALSQNRYTYVQNDPVNYIDPTGHVAKVVQPVSKTKTVKTPSASAVNSMTPAVTKTAQLNPAKKTSTTILNNTNQTKKGVTAIPTLPTPSPVNNKNSANSSGEAKAAQIAKVPNASGKLATNIVGSVLSNSYRPLQENDPGSKTNWIADMLGAIQSFGRRICDDNMQRIERDLEVNNRTSEIIWSALGTAGNGIKQTFIAGAQAVKQILDLSVEVQIQNQRNDLQLQSDVSDLVLNMIVSAGNATGQFIYDNQSRRLQQQKQEKMMAVTCLWRPMTEEVQSWLLTKPGTFQIGSNGTINSGLTVSGEIGWAMDTTGNIGFYHTFSKGSTSGKGGSLSQVITLTNAPNISKLDGPSISFGASGGEEFGFGLSSEWFEDEETGEKYRGASRSTGLSFGSPFEVHITESNTKVYTLFNVFNELYKIYDHIERW